MVLMIRGVGGGVNVGKGEGGVILLLVRSVDSGICVCGLSNRKSVASGNGAFGP